MFLRNAGVCCVRADNRHRFGIVPYAIESECSRNPCRVEEDQIPCLKAAYAKDKPKLVHKDGTEYPLRKAMRKTLAAKPPLQKNAERNLLQNVRDSPAITLVDG